jgi:hypothetical protein
MRLGRNIVPGAALLVSAALGIATSTASAQTYVFGRAHFATGNSPAAAVVGGFDGDGKLDLAVANPSDNRASILLGQPDSTFGPKAVYAVGKSPSALVVADFNLAG